MTRRTVARYLTLGLLAVASGARADDKPVAPIFKAGFAERDITPEVGMEAPGGYGKAYHKTIHDPCKVRASVFDDGKTKVAVVGIDALGIRRDSVLKVRNEIHDKTGIPTDAILIGASHSHSSGPCVWIKRGEFDHASPLVQRLAYRGIDQRGPEVSRHGREGPRRGRLRGPRRPRRGQGRGRQGGRRDGRLQPPVPDARWPRV